jgi:hypothetical protein
MIHQLLDSLGLEKRKQKLYVHGFPSLYGGPGAELHHQIPIWQSLGMQVHIIPTHAGYKNEPLYPELLSAGVVVHRDNQFSAIERGAPVFGYCSTDFLQNLDAILEHSICGVSLLFTIACASGGACQFQQTLTLKCPESSSSSSSSSSGSSINCPAITLTNLGCNASGGLNIGVTCSNLPSTPAYYQFTYTSTAWTAPYDGPASLLTASFTESTPSSLPPLDGETEAVTKLANRPTAGTFR